MVISRNCRGRLWRSEQEVDPGGDEAVEASAQRLRQRQKDRAPCMCDTDEGVQGEG